ncbi:hypothetical protein LCGC14_1089380 [marine sediment metagenome]|uniref:Uncharacterized protein n=1 Tax=marine sediment metagenome TaxID=412755 RepID=A0A0F9MD21_9ZZZZ
MRAVDFSEYQRLPSQRWFDGLRPEHGVEGVIIQAWGGGPISGRRNEYLGQVTERTRRAGLRMATYIWPAEDVIEALGWIGSKNPDWVALDYEAGSRPLPGQVRRVQDAGHHPVMYTFPSYWRHDLGNPSGYQGVDLWLSRGYYSNTHPKRQTVWWPDNDEYDPFGSFAGRIDSWSFAIGWQFQGTTALTSGGDTVGVDLNVFQRWPRPAATEPEKPEPGDGQEEDSMRLITTPGSRSVWYVGGGVRKHVANRQTLAMLRYMMKAAGQDTEATEMDLELLRRITTELGSINLVGWNG